MAGTTSFYYDNNGNLVEQLPPGAYISHWYTYNQRHLLTSQGRSQLAENITIASFGYDGAGHRLTQTDHTTPGGPTTTTYTNDILGLSQVLAADDGSSQVYNLFGLDLISQDDDGETRTLLADGLGSVRVEMVDAAIESITTYEPYGSLLARTGTSETSYGFTGEQEDTTTSLLYLRARYYNPALHTFMTKDPWKGSIRLPNTLHGFAYAFGNPIRFVDPRGLDCVDTSYGGVWCYTDPLNATNSSQTQPITLLNYPKNLDGHWDILVYVRPPGTQEVPGPFYSEVVMPGLNCSVELGLGVGVSNETVHGRYYQNPYDFVMGVVDHATGGVFSDSLWPNEQYPWTTYSQTNVNAEIGVGPVSLYQEISETPLGGGAVEMSNAEGVEVTAFDVIGVSNEVSNGLGSYETSFNPPTLPCGGPGTPLSGFNVGYNYDRTDMIQVAVPSWLNQTYIDKTALLKESMIEVWNDGYQWFLETRFSNIYAPYSIQSHMAQYFPTQAVFYPFNESADNMSLQTGVTNSCTGN